MVYALLWYLILAGIGFALFPISFVVFKPLNDKGYGFSKSLGLLLWGVLFWWGSLLKIVGNSFSGIFFVLILLLVISFFFYLKNSLEINSWLKNKKNYIVLVEVLFFVSFFLFVIWKGFNPLIANTEKPMELAFINSIIHSESMPPADPWLSGYSISYYYLGYVLVALLAKFSGITGGIAFNLGLGLIFSLSSVNAYSLLFNILSINKQKKKDYKLAALAGPFFLLLVSNAEGFLELIHARQFFWNQNLDGSWRSKFWQWLAIPDLSSAPISSEPSWLIRNFQSGGWWWWRASRVIQDFNFRGQAKEIIDEFPVFSFRLGDLHPHVLSIPFALLSIGFALTIFLHPKKVVDQQKRFSSKLGFFNLSISFPEFLIASSLFGSLMFINFWDIPVYLAIFCAVVVVRNVGSDGWKWKRMWEFLLHFFSIAIFGYILFLPFHLSFSSQAGGIIPNIVYITRGAHFWVMFLPFLIPIFMYLFLLSRSSKDEIKNSGFISIFFFLMLLIFVILLSTFIVGILPDFLGNFSQAASIFMENMGADGSFQELIIEGLRRRIVHPGTWITLLMIISLSLPIFIRMKSKKEVEVVEDKNIFVFINILLLFGSFMVLIPEFVYLRDFFGYRINTIFKFYYQTWIIWSIVVSFIVIQLFSAFKGWKNFFVSIILILSISTGIIYTGFAIADVLPDIGQDFFANWNIDGTSASIYLSQSEQEAVNWLWGQTQDVLVEAVGDSYSNFGRISSHSGQISVLGWKGHEGQWRGSYAPQGTREQDIKALYETTSSDEAFTIVENYKIKYIFIGSLERNTYQVNVEKFELFTDNVFELGDVIIYQVR